MSEQSLSKGVPRLYSPKLNSPKLYSPKITPPKLEAPFKGNLTIPEHKHVTDLGDLILGSPISGTKQLRMTLMDAGLEHWAYVPLVNRVIGLVLTAKERALDPIVEGKPQKALVNMLETASGSVDMFANPVKSLFNAAGGGSSADLMRSMGWMEGEYRQKYQFNTGSFIANMALETITDPLTYLSIGMSAVASQGAKASAEGMEAGFRQYLRQFMSEEAVEQAMQEIDVNALKKILEEQLRLGKQLAPEDYYAWIQSQLSRKQRNIQTLISDISDTSLKNVKNKEMFDNLLQAKDLLTMDQIAEQVASIRYTDGYRKFIMASKLADTQKYLGYAANVMVPTGFVTSMFLDRIVKPVFKSIWTSTINKFKNYDVETILNNPNFVIEELNETQRLKFTAVNKNTAEVVINTQTALTELFGIMNRASLYHKGDELWLKAEYTKWITQNMFNLTTGVSANVSELLNDTLLYMGKSGKLSQEAVDLYIKSQKDIIDKVADNLIDLAVMNEATRITVTSFVRDTLTRDFNKWYTSDSLEYAANLFVNGLGEGLEDINNANPYERILYVYDQIFQKDMNSSKLELLAKSSRNNRRNMSLFVWAGINKDNVDIIGANVQNFYKTGDKTYLKNIIDQVKELQTDYITRVPKSESVNRFLTTVKYNTKQLDPTLHKALTDIPAEKETKKLGYYDAIEKIEQDNTLTKQEKKRQIEIVQAKGAITQYEKTIPELMRIKDTVNAYSKAFEGDLKQYRALNNDTVDIVFEMRDRARTAGLPIPDTPDEWTHMVDRWENVTEEFHPLKELMAIQNVLQPYDGADESDADIIMKLFDHPIFNFMLNTETDEALIQSGKELDKLLPDFYKTTEEVLDKVKRINWTITSSKKAFERSRIKDNPMMLDFLLSLQESLTVLQNTDTFMAMAQTFALNEKTYTLQLQLAERFAYINVQLRLLDEDKIRVILDPTSETRIALEKLRLNSLNSKDIDYKVFGENLTQVLSRIDFHTNLGNLVHDWEVVVDAMNLPKEQTDFIKVLMFDKIFQIQRNESLYKDANTVLANLDSLVNNFISGLKAWDNHIKHTDLLPEISDELLEELRYKVKTIYKGYLDKQLNIGARYGFAITPTLRWLDGDSNRYLRTLGWTDEAVLNNLKKVDIDIVEQSSIIEGLNTIVPMNPKNYMNDAYNLAIESDVYITNKHDNPRIKKATMDELKRQEQLMLDLQAEAHDKVNSIYAAVEEGWHTVGMQNKVLRGSDVELGTMFHIGDEGEGFIQKIHNYNRCLRESQITPMLAEIDTATNLYELSILDGKISFHLEYDPKFAAKRHIDLESLGATNMLVGKDKITFNANVTQYDIFYQNYNNALNNLQRRLRVRVTDDSTTGYELIREKLIDVFTEAKQKGWVSWAPYDPEFYFNNIGNEDLLIWFSLSRNKYVNKQLAAVMDPWWQELSDNWEERVLKPLRDTYIDEVKQSTALRADTQLRQALGIISRYDDIKNEYKATGTFDDANIYKAINRSAENELIAFQANSLEAVEDLFLDDRTALANEKILDGYIRSDKEHIINLNPVIALTQDTRTVADYNYNDEDMLILGMLGVKKDTPLNDKSIGQVMHLDRSQLIVQSVESWTPEQLATHLQNVGNVTMYKYAPINKEQVTSKWATMQEELDKVGIKVFKMNYDNNPENLNPALLFIKTGDTIYNEQPTWFTGKYYFQDLQDVVTDSFKKNTEIFEDAVIPFDIWDGSMINRLDWQRIEDHMPELIKGAGYWNEREREMWEQFLAKNTNNYLKDGMSRQMGMILGDRDFYNDILNSPVMMKAFSDLGQEPIYHPTSLIKSAISGTYSASHGRSNINKYLTFFMPNKEFKLSGKFWQDIIAELDDAQIKRLFDYNNYAAVVLKEDRKGLPRVYKLPIANKHDFDVAMKAGAIGITHDVYRNMVLVVNKREATNGFMKFYRHIIMPLYKTIAISTPGMVLRNGLDSDIFKNGLATDGIKGMIETVKFEVQAARDLDWYDKAYQKLIKVAESRGAKFPSADETLAFFDALSNEDAFKFHLITLYQTTGASSGLTESLAEQIIGKNLENKLGKMSKADMAINTWKQIIGNNFYVKELRGINDLFEDSARFGLILRLLNQGEDVPTAIRNVINTHFDYGAKILGSDFMEQMFWFSTFPLNNFMFYMNTGMEKNPMLLKMQLDALKLSWNDGEEFTWEKVKKSDYLMYNALAGNIRFKFNGKNVILKTGSSMMDFAGMLFDPYGALIQRLNPFAASIIAPEEMGRLNPFLTPYNRLQQIISGNSYIPSLYSTMKDFKYWWNPTKRRPYSGGGSSWRPKKPHKATSNPISFKRVSRILTRRFSDQFHFNRYYWRPQNKPAVYIQNKRQLQHAARLATNHIIGRKYLSNKVYADITRNYINKRNTI